MLPTTQEYKISLMIGQDSFRTLEGVEVIPNPNYPDEPWYSTGGLAIVFKLKLKDKLYALKCFYTEANERQERLGLIAAYLKQNPSPYFVDFTYLEDELWVETTNNEGQGYPVVLMEWVEGKTLDNYLEQICTQNNTPALKNLYFQFCNLAWWLQQQPIAHGDIKHDNLIVTPDGKLKLIDYDGVFVPALRGRKANEMGSPCYQHPKRDAYFFDKNLDDFSLLVLQITLLALQHQPKLFTEHYNGDGIILKDTDYQNFAQSPIKTILWQLPEVKIPLLLSQLQGNLNNLSAIDLLPLLQDVAWINWLVGGQRDGKLNFERERLKEFILVQGGRDWRKWFIDYVSNNYPLNSELIEKYKDIWHWRKKMSGNEFLPWSIELIEKYEDKLLWNGYSDDDLSKNKSLPWSIELIAKYETKWNWFGISKNESLPWSVELVQKFKDKLIWNILVENKSIPWSMELVKTFNKKLTWRNLSMFKFLPWSIELVEKHKVKWDWNELSNNKYLPWSIELIETCKNELNWENLSYNQSLPWSIELIERYKDSWKWGNLSNNISLPWSIELIEKYEDKWKWGRLDQRDWRSLSSNEGLPWSIELIAKYEKKWDWISLSENDSLPWSIELLEMYKENWEWGWYSHGQEHYFNRLGINSLKSLPWSIDLIERYEDKWEWTILSNNVYLPWSMELIEKFKDKWIFEGSYDLQSNESLPWSLELIDKFKDKWIIGSSCNKSIYKKVLKPFLDDEFIDEIMNVINQKFKKKEITKRDIWMDEF